MGRIHRPFLAAWLLAAAQAVYSQTPQIYPGGIVNAASFSPSSTAAGELAPGSLAAIFGSGFVEKPFLASNIPLPGSLGGVSVEINGVTAPLLSVFPGQINAQIPWQTPVGANVSVVVRNGAGSDVEVIRMTPVSPGIFTLTQNGNGPAAAANASDGTLAQPPGKYPGSPSRRAQPGETVLLWATGLGPTSPPAITGTNSLDQLRPAQVKPIVLIGGIAAEVQFAGLSPEFVGVNQINVRIPQNVSAGSAVPVQLQTSGITTSTFVTIAIDDGVQSFDPNLTIKPSVRRVIPKQVMGHTLYWPWTPYFASSRGALSPQSWDLFSQLDPGIIGHYPGVGVITHDFHWKNLIGPLSGRTDPTPREESFDTQLGLSFGPDEFGAFVEDWRKRSGNAALESSIQVNVISGSAEEAADWVEYMNAPNNGSNPGGGVDWAAVRAGNGHPEPYGIRYWELGNEPHYTAANIGSLSAWDYVKVIRSFVPAMKARDSSIQVMAYTNPFKIGAGSVIGEASEDTPAGPPPSDINESSSNLTWTQAVVKHGGPLLDMLYFHWYSGWNMDASTYEFTVMSPRLGLVPWLDRLQRDITAFAPDEATRSRLRQSVAIPEWNSYGGWFNPLRAGTALSGAIASSRVLHVLAERSEVQMAQRFGLAAPYDTEDFAPIMNLPFPFNYFADIRAGYMAAANRNQGVETLPSALFEMHKLWERAFLPNLLESVLVDPPVNARGATWLDATAMRSADGSQVHIVLTNAYDSPVSLPVSVGDGLQLAPGATVLTLTGDELLSANRYSDRNQAVVVESTLRTDGNSFVVELPPWSVTGVLATVQP